MIKKFLIATAMVVALTGTAAAQGIEGAENSLLSQVTTLEAEADALEAEVNTLEAEMNVLEAEVDARVTALENSIFGDDIPVITALTTQGRPVNADYTMVMPTMGDFAIVEPVGGFWNQAGKRATRLLVWRAGGTSASSRSMLIKPSGVLKVLILPEGWQIVERVPTN